MTADYATDEAYITDEARGDKRSFVSKPRYVQAAVIVAGNTADAGASGMILNSGVA